jgi:hypothetical protein
MLFAGIDALFVGAVNAIVGATLVAVIVTGAEKPADPSAAIALAVSV